MSEEVMARIFIISVLDDLKTNLTKLSQEELDLLSTKVLNLKTEFITE